MKVRELIEDDVSGTESAPSLDLKIGSDPIPENSCFINYITVSIIDYEKCPAWY
jgi:hypothetical protein